MATPDELNDDVFREYAKKILEHSAEDFRNTYEAGWDPGTDRQWTFRSRPSSRVYTREGEKPREDPQQKTRREIEYVVRTKVAYLRSNGSLPWREDRDKKIADLVLAFIVREAQRGKLGTHISDTFVTDCINEFIQMALRSK